MRNPVIFSLLIMLLTITYILTVTVLYVEDIGKNGFSKVYNHRRQEKLSHMTGFCNAVFLFCQYDNI